MITVTIEYFIKPGREEEYAELTLNFEEDGALYVYYDSNTPIAGFQFNVSGDDLELLEAGGGAAEEAGFTVETNDSMIMGFSLTGGSILAGEGVLTTLSFVDSGDQPAFMEQPLILW